MKKQNITGTGLEVSRICLGTGGFGDRTDRRQAFELLDRFRDLGGNFIDTANAYCRWIPGMDNSSEQYIGEWLKERNAFSGMVIATKGGHYDVSLPAVSRVNKDAVRRDLEDSLRTLGVDCIDLYWLHRDDPAMDIGEILGFMEEFAAQGKLRVYGASNFTGKRLKEAADYAVLHKISGFCAVSNQWSAASVNPGKNLNQDKSLVMMNGELYRWHSETRVPMVPFSSSAHGFFSKLEGEGIRVPDRDLTREDVINVWKTSSMAGNLKEAYLNERNLRLYRTLTRAAKDYGVSLYAMTQAYFFHRPFPVFPVGAVSRAEQLLDFQAADECELDKELIKRLEECGVE